ncbi:MAG TPA: ArsA family ATPase [Planctomycetota bacterium]|nr:ArsA family ATPase [Planctomycetota bacterium]
MTEPNFHFFAGKGGVGKTTSSAAAAIAAAERGGRVLLVSTDPAHTLGDALEVRLGPRKKRVPVRRGRLEAVELDADSALARWLEERHDVLRTIAERGTYLDAQDVERFLRLSLPGVDELVGLLELVRLARGHEHVVVDTAPTGHTLRLLQMPETLRKIATVFDDMQEKHRLVARTLGRGYRADRSDALIDEIDEEGRELAALVRDGERVRFTWVLLPELLSVAEAHDGIEALERSGIDVSDVLVNRVSPRPTVRCDLCTPRHGAEVAAIARLRVRVPVRLVPALEEEPRGIAALRKLAKATVPTTPRASRVARARPRKRVTTPLPLEVPRTVRLLLFGGKGGTGKTTCAAAAALALARDEPERRILLLSTDPAHSLGDALDRGLGDAPTRLAKNLEARELDAPAAFAARRERFREAVDEIFETLRGGSAFDATYDHAVARDLIDLAPPGIDELFAILAVVEALLPEAGPPSHDLLIMDTAPTGHALRLLAMPESAQEWVKTLLQVLLKYREVTGLGRLAEDLIELSRSLRNLRALLADPEKTRFVPVTRPASVPREGTRRLLAALDGLGIAAPTVIVNAVTPDSTKCPRCRRANARERRELSLLARLTGNRDTLVARATAPPPRGARALEEWGRTWQPL